MTSLKQVQENVMGMVERGELTKEAATIIVLTKGLEMLEDALRGKSWEKTEHPEFFAETD